MGALVLIAIAALLALVGTAVFTFAMDALEKIPDYTLGIEDVINSYSTDGKLTSSLSISVMAVGFALLTMVFLWKGFQTYILYSGGDPDSDPVQLVTNYCKGVAVICGFSTVLKWFTVSLNNWINDLLTTIKNVTQTAYSTDDIIGAFFDLSEDNVKELLVPAVMGIIFGVLSIIVFFSCLRTGVEFYILQVGMPLAAVGLLNADKGIFKNYFMSLSKALVTILFKLVVCQLGYSITMASMTIDSIYTTNVQSVIGFVMGIAILTVALGAPRLLGEFMAPSGGGQSFMMKAYYTSSMFHRVSHIFRR